MSLLKTVDKAVILTGNRGLARRMQTWLGLSPFAVEPKRVSG